MNKSKLITLFAILMVALNLILVFFLWNKKPHHPKNEGPKQVIIERLDFDENQIQAYELLIDVHKLKVQELNSEIGELKQLLFQTLITKDQASKDAVMLVLESKKREIEELNYVHFQELKSLCSLEQEDAFVLLVDDLGKLFGPRNKPPKK
jgi:uncharacterized membrane protein YhiD involved in acid resistance